MNGIKVIWNKVNPADLSSTCCAEFFAFSRNKDIFHIDDINKSCLFTKVIQASANFRCSIYDIEIWAGYVTEGIKNLDKAVRSADMYDVLEWSAKLQLQESWSVENDLLAS